MQTLPQTFAWQNDTLTSVQSANQATARKYRYFRQRKHYANVTANVCMAKGHVNIGTIGKPSYRTEISVFSAKKTLCKRYRKRLHGKKTR